MKIRLKLPQMTIGNSVTQEIVQIKAYLLQLVQDLEYELQNLNDVNLNDKYKEEQDKQKRLPVGTVVFRKEEKANAGFSYGKWNKTKTEGTFFAYVREE